MTNHETSNPGSLRELAEQASREPLTMKDRVVGLVLALVFAGVGVAMILRPVIFTFDGDGPSGRRGRQIVTILEWVWSRPVGAVAILLALLMIWGALTKKNPAQQGKNAGGV